MAILLYLLIVIVSFYILPNYCMVNSDSIFNLSNGVTSNWCIKLDTKFMLALSCVGRNACGICYKKRRKKYKHALFTQIAIHLKFVWLINTFPIWCIVNHKMNPRAYVNS